MGSQVGVRLAPWTGATRLQRVCELLEVADSVYPVQRPPADAGAWEWDAWRRARSLRVMASNIV